MTLHAVYFVRFLQFHTRNNIIMKLFFPLAITGLIFIYSSCEPKNKALEEKDDPQLSKLKAPEGFTISFFAKDVNNARSLALGDNGTVFVGNRKGKKCLRARGCR